MRLLVVSDIHYELIDKRHGDESRAFKWLLDISRRAAPDGLIGLGDWGNSWTIDDWITLARVVKIYAIYGNHENLPILQSVKNLDGARIWVKDSVVPIGGLRFGFLNGIVSDTKRFKGGVPRRTTDEYEYAAAQLSAVDILCTHESPMVPEYEGRIAPNGGAVLLGPIITKLRPKVAFSGHISGPYTAARIGDTVSVRVDSSPSEKHYAVLDTECNEVVIWHDKNSAESVLVPRLRAQDC